MDDCWLVLNWDGLWRVFGRFLCEETGNRAVQF